MSDFAITPDLGAINALEDDAMVTGFVEEAGAVVVDLAKAGAPKLTGAGAAGISAETGSDGEGPYVDVGWAAEHFYLGFAESGNSRQPATPFLRPALDRARV